LLDTYTVTHTQRICAASVRNDAKNVLFGNVYNRYLKTNK